MAPVKAPIPSNIIKFRGIFDYYGLLKEMQQWVVDSGYEWHENVYKHKVPSPAGAEQEIKWTGNLKVNAYAKYWVNVYFHLWDLKDVEVVKDGKKQMMNSARLQILFSGYVELDYNDVFG